MSPAWDPEIEITKVNGQGDLSSFLLGNWITYKMNIDIPITDTDKKIEVEVCTNGEMSENHMNALALINHSIENVGDNLIDVSWKNDIEYLDVGGNQVARFRIIISYLYSSRW